MDFGKLSVDAHRSAKGKLGIVSKFPLENRKDLSIAYTPGVAEVSRVIAKDESLAKELTMIGNSVAVVSDGSAVLGLGNIGPKAAYAVMEGKSVLFKHFANIDAVPIVLDTQDTEEIIRTVKNIAPGFSGINLEDISAPRCFEIEERLKTELDIPVFHDDQHGTAIVVLAGLINAIKLSGRNRKQVKIAISGAGAAGVAVAKLLNLYGFTDIVMVDSTGIISSKRDDLNSVKQMLLDFTNKTDVDGELIDALKDRDIFIGVSAPNILSKEMIGFMADDPIIFAMANPIPEIMPEEAEEAGSRIIATGRSDYPNQLNNVLAFPGVFRGALDNGITSITDEMKISAAENLASLISSPREDKIIPGPFDKGVVEAVSRGIRD